jgi:hypothetical protein
LLERYARAVWNVFNNGATVTADITALEPGEGIPLVTELERTLKQAPIEEMVIRVGFGERRAERIKMRASLEQIARDHELPVRVQVQG